MLPSDAYTFKAHGYDSPPVAPAEFNLNTKAHRQFLPAVSQRNLRKSCVQMIRSPTLLRTGVGTQAGAPRLCEHMYSVARHHAAPLCKTSSSSSNRLRMGFKTFTTYIHVLTNTTFSACKPAMRCWLLTMI